MFLGPHDSWPRHSRPEAQAALTEARSAGWYFKPSKGHAFGRLRCRPVDVATQADSCSVPIYSTSGRSDGSETARVILSALRKCTHQIPSGVRSLDPLESADLARGKIVTTRRLLEAAESLLLKEDVLQDAAIIEAEILLKLEEDWPANIDDAVSRITRLEQLAATHDGEALAAAARANASDPWPPIQGARELRDRANESLAELSALVEEATGNSEQQRISGEHDELSQRLAILSRRIGTGR